MILIDLEWQVVLLSLKVFFLVVLFSLLFGIFFVWLLVCCMFLGKVLFDSVLYLLLVLLFVVVGYLLLVLMGWCGFIGECLYDWFGIIFVFSWCGVVFVVVVMLFLLMVWVICLVLEGVDVKLEQVVRILGVGCWCVFFIIMLLLILLGIIVGMVLVFVCFFGEFGVIIIFVLNISGEM